jgi:RNA polymerase sigma factor (sigma-70 family)
VLRHAKTERRRELIWTMAGGTDEAAIEDVGAMLASRDEIERGFADLSLDQRAVIVLRFYVGLPLEEVAEVLGVPVGTVKSRLHRATQALRASLMAADRLVAHREGRA